MTKQDINSIKWPSHFTQKDKEGWLYYLQKRAEDQTRLCVIYNPDCGCPIDQDFVLDRYPMSPIILCQCPNCKKGCHMKISDPIRFYLPLTKQEIGLDELKEAYITESDQKIFIDIYRNSGRK